MSRVLLSDSISKARAEDREQSFENTKDGDTLAEITLAEIPVQSGSSVAPKKRLAISPPWQPDTTIPFELVRLAGPDKLLVFEVVSTDERITQVKYLIAIADREVEIFTPPKMPRSLKDVHSVIYRDKDKYAGPNGRETVLNILWSRDWKGKTYKELKMTDPVISTLIREIREQKYMVSGLPISPSFFPTAISALFLISAFSFLGPILRINDKKPDFNNEVWIMAIDCRGQLGGC